LEQSVAAGAPAGVDPEFHRRAVTQATRELLLAQSSDWPFLIRMGTAREYAMGRFDGHLAAFHRLMDGALGEASPDHRLLLEREAAYPLFAETTSGQPTRTARDP
jgi:1,4-alpha-glucan branching enzyme